MTERDKKFIASWKPKIDNGWVAYFFKVILFTCLVSMLVILFYTWNNIPKGKLLASAGPLSMLIFGLGIPIGIFIGWRTWTQNNNRYKRLTSGQEIIPQGAKKEWFGKDKIWDVLASSIAGIYFILFYIGIFLFDTGLSPVIKYLMVWTFLGYFITLFIYKIYRYQLDQSGNIRKFPTGFKFAFSLIVLLTTSRG